MKEIRTKFFALAAELNRPMADKINHFVTDRDVRAALHHRVYVTKLHAVRAGYEQGTKILERLLQEVNQEIARHATARTPCQYSLY